MISEWKTDRVLREKCPGERLEGESVTLTTPLIDDVDYVVSDQATDICFLSKLPLTIVYILESIPSLLVKIFETQKVHFNNHFSCVAFFLFSFVIQ